MNITNSGLKGSEPVGQVLPIHGLFGFLLLMIALLSSGWYFYLSNTMEKFTHVDEAWSEYNEQAAIYNSDLSIIIQYLGYGGLIHHFKNYILRQSPQSLAVLHHDFSTLDHTIQNFRSHSLSVDELEQLDQLLRVIQQYQEKTTLAETLIQQGISPKDLDAQVKVNDRPAFDAIQKFRENSLLRSLNAEARTESSIIQAFHQLSYGYLMMALFVLFGAMIFFLLRAQERAKMLAQQAFHRVDNLLNSVPDAMLIVDADGKIVRCNVMSTKLFDYSSEDLLLMSVESLMPKEFRAGHATLRHSYAKNPYPRMMNSDDLLYALNSHDESFPVEISLSFDDSDAENVLFILTVRDVSEHQKQRLEITAAREKAEQALSDLKIAQGVLIESEKLAALGNLVAGVAHEINTPVGLSLTASSYLREKTKIVQQQYNEEQLTADGLDQYLAQAEESTRLIETNAMRAAELIQSFKQVAVDQTAGQLRSFDLGGYLHEIALSFYPIFKRTSIRFEVSCDEDIEMLSYPGALAQLLSNLINNSLLHAFVDGQVGSLLLQARLLNQDTVEIVCTDDGCGMDMHTKDHLFDPFFTTRRGQGGSGLGMYIVHNILQKQIQGSIQVESTLGQGSRFIVRFSRQLIVREVV